MMNKKLIFLLSLIAIIIGLMIYKQSSKSPIVHKKKDATDVNTGDNHSPYILHDTNKTSLVKSKTIPNIKVTHKKQILHKKAMIYETLSIDEVTSITKPRNRIHPISAVKVNTLAITSLNQKDTMTLSDIEGIDYNILISDTHKNNNGSFSITGSFTDEGVTYTTTITHSSTSTFMNIATPNGVYEIETNNGIGFTYKASDIRRQLQTSRKNDVIVLPIPKRPKLQ